MARTEELLVLPEEDGQRLDKFLSERLEELTRTAAEKLAISGKVCKSGVALSKSYKVRAGDCIAVTIPAPVEAEVLPEAIPLDIVYEDADLLVVNKPKGMVVHPAAGNPSGTLVNALLAHCGDSLSGIGGVIRPGIVHRIDKDTSGLLIACKNDGAHQAIAAQLKEHSVTRRYLAIVHGQMKEERGVIHAPVGRNPRDRMKMAVVASGGKDAVTHYQVVKQWEKYDLVQCRLETGRTHQIRVHMAHCRHPLAGDYVYGPDPCPVKLMGVTWEGQALHAGVFGFVHPTTSRYMEFQAPPPDYFAALMERMK